MSSAIPTRPFAGPVLDTYGSWSVAVDQIGRTLKGQSPGALRLQGWPETQGRNVADARRRWPGVLLGLAPGVDPIATRWRKHRSHDRAVAELVTIADGTVALGVGHLAFDPEAAWKALDQSTRAELSTIASTALDQIAAKHAGLRLYVTSYGWPVRVDGVGGHGDYPWRGWLPGNGVTYIGQTYDRRRGQLIEGERVAVRSYLEAVRIGLMEHTTPRLPEVQTHHNDPHELVQVATSADACFLWASGTADLFDADGATAWRRMVTLHRLGFWGRTREYQAQRGLKVDGDVGPQTAAALDADARTLGLA